MLSRSSVLIILSVVLSVFVPYLTAQYVRSVGQDVFLDKCVLLSTSKSVRKTLKLWDVSGGKFGWMSGILVVILI